MGYVADGFEAQDAQIARQIDHGLQGFGREAVAPLVFGEDIAGGRALRRLKHETGAAQQAAVFAIQDEIGARRRPLPFAVAPGKESKGVSEIAVGGPAQVFRDRGVAGIAAEDGFSVGLYRAPQVETRCFEDFAVFHDSEQPAGMDKLPADVG